jgi:hypothetical protein
MSKFNSGHLRSVNVIADSSSLNPNQSLSEGGYYFPGTTTSTTGDATGANAGGGNPAAGGGGASNGNNTITGSASTTKENEIQPKVDSNPNSTKPVVVDEAQRKVGGTTTNTGTTDTTPKNESEKSNKQGDSQQDPTADANATSKRGFTYEIVVEGTKKSVIVKDKDGNVQTKTPFVGGKTDVELIELAKLSVNDK